MYNQTKKLALVVAIAGAVVVAAVAPSWSAPVLSISAAAKAAAASDVTDVRYRGYRNNNAGAAVALGILGVATAVAITNSQRRHRNYGYPQQRFYQQGYGDPYRGGYARGPVPYGYRY